MKPFKKFIAEIADFNPPRYPRRGEEFNNYINAMFGERGDIKRPWTTKPSKKIKPKVLNKYENIKRKRQNIGSQPPFISNSAHNWLKDKIGDHIPFTHWVPTSENMTSINLPVRSVSYHNRDKNFIIELGADSYIENLDKYNISHLDALTYHPTSSHDELKDHLTKIGAIDGNPVKNRSSGKLIRPIGTINVDRGNLEWGKEPTLRIEISKQHVINAYKRRTP